MNNESGNVGMIFAASIIPVVMLIGSAVDFGDASKKRATLQLAIDAAALAAARTVDDDVTAAIDEAARSSRRKSRAPRSRASCRPSRPSCTITLTAHVASKTAFMKIVNIDEFNLNVRAVAERGQEELSGDSTADGKVCLLALDPNATHGLEMQGSKTADLGTCWSYVNSETAESVDDTGNSYSFVSSGVCTVGLSLDHSDNFSIKPREGCSAMADPFANTGAYPSASAWSPKLTMPQITDKDCKAGTLNLKKGTSISIPASTAAASGCRRRPRSRSSPASTRSPMVRYTPPPARSSPGPTYLLLRRRPELDLHGCPEHGYPGRRYRQPDRPSRGSTWTRVW